MDKNQSKPADQPDRLTEPEGLTEKEREVLLKLFDGVLDLDQELNLQGFLTFEYLKKIVCLLQQKVCIEQKGFPELNDRLDTIICQLNTKINQENMIIDRLDTIIEQLETKIALETPQPPLACECSILGSGTGDISMAITGQLVIEVCLDCTIAGSSFDYNAFNPQNQSIREVISTVINQVVCNLDEYGDGTVAINGTALIRTGVGGPFRAGTFSLLLNVNEFSVTSFIINADNISDTVENIPPGEIIVTPCDN